MPSNRPSFTTRATGVPQDSGERIETAVLETLRKQMGAPLTPGLYVVATPIGNLADITVRALSVLARCDVICCEDTRHSFRLLQHYAISRPMLPYHEHSTERDRARIEAEVAAGRTVALISDAGTPLISDPGFKLVRTIRANGHNVWSIPGPSAAIAALAVSGLPTDRFFFEGFLPATSGARVGRLKELSEIPSTIVIYEAPHRLVETLHDIAETLPGRDGAVARELTKMHEELRTGAIGDLLAAARDTGSIKGEIVILIGPAPKSAATDAEILSRLTNALRDMSLSEAARVIARDLGVRKGRVYDLGLSLRKGEP